MQPLAATVLPFLVRLAALVLCAALALHVPQARAQPPRGLRLALDDLVVDNQAGRLASRFSLSVSDTDQLGAVLRGGATLTLACEAVLYRQRSLWTDKELARGRLDSRLAADQLTREFLLWPPGRPRPLRDRDLARLLAQGWGGLSLDLGPFGLLERGNDYTLSLDVRLVQEEVPGWLKDSLFFWSWEAAPSLNYDMDFSY